MVLNNIILKLQVVCTETNKSINLQKPFCNFSSKLVDNVPRIQPFHFAISKVYCWVRAVCCIYYPILRLVFNKLGMFNKKWRVL